MKKRETHGDLREAWLFFGRLTRFRVSAFVDIDAAQNVVPSKFARARWLGVELLGAIRQDYSKLKRVLSGTIDVPRSSMSRRGLCIDGLEVTALADDIGAEQDTLYNPHAEARKLDVAGSPSSFRQGNLKLKRGLSGTIDGLKVSALADTGAAENVVSSTFATARKLDVAGSPRSFRQGNSKLAHTLGTSTTDLAI